MAGIGEFAMSSGGGSAIGSLVSGVFNLIGNAINNRAQRKEAERQFGREKELMGIQQDNALAQMAQSQDYNVANMELQNQYQIDAENRANAWNDIGAQIQRARKAGVSPVAAIGSGGAGGLMSVSSAPSSATPSPAGAASGHASKANVGFSGFADALNGGAMVGLQAARAKAEIDNLNADTDGKRLDNELKTSTMEANKLWATIRNKNAELDASIKSLDLSIKEIALENEPERQRLALKKSLAEILNIETNTQNSKNLTAVEIEQKKQAIKESMSVIRLNAAQAGLYGAQTELTEKQAVTEGYRALVTANEAQRVAMLTRLGLQEVEAQRIANEFNKAHNDFKKEHFSSDRRWEKSAMLVDMGTSVVSTICGVVGCAVSGGLIQPPRSTTISTTEKRGKVVVTTTHTEKNR